MMDRQFTVSTASILLLFAALPITAAAASDTATLEQLEKTQEQVISKQQELTALDAKIKALQTKQNDTANQAELAADQIKRLSKQLETSQLEVEQTVLAITAAKTNIDQTNDDIDLVRDHIQDNKQLIGDTVRSLYQHEQETFLDILLSSPSLGVWLAERRTYRELQARAVELVQELQQRRSDLEQRQEELLQQQRSLEKLSELQAYQQNDLSQQRREQAHVLSLKQQEQADHQHRLAEAKQARSEIERDIFTLQNVGIELSLTDAFSIARYASNITGVRPALLLAVLKIESNVGENLGSGTFPDDMHPASREAFLRLTNKLGLDPQQAPISRRPASYKGWGGAMGPGQFMPDTWERLASRLTQLMGKPVANPYELTDALVATGMMLADRGARESNKEFEAVSRFLAGPNWRYHSWYGTRVLAVAEEYEQEGL